MDAQLQAMMQGMGGGGAPSGVAPDVSSNRQREITTLELIMTIDAHE